MTVSAGRTLRPVSTTVLAPVRLWPLGTPVGRRARTGYTPGALLRPSINGNTTGGGHLSYDAAHHRWTCYCEQAGVEVDIHQLRHTHATELINNGISIEADAVLGLTARIQRFGC